MEWGSLRELENARRARAIALLGVLAFLSVFAIFPTTARAGLITDDLLDEVGEVVESVATVGADEGSGDALPPADELVETPDGEAGEISDYLTKVLEVTTEAPPWLAAAIEDLENLPADWREAIEDLGILTPVPVPQPAPVPQPVPTPAPVPSESVQPAVDTAANGVPSVSVSDSSGYSGPMLTGQNPIPASTGVLLTEGDRSGSTRLHSGEAYVIVGDLAFPGQPKTPSLSRYVPGAAQPVPEAPAAAGEPDNSRTVRVVGSLAERVDLSLALAVLVAALGLGRWSWQRSRSGHAVFPARRKPVG